FPGAGMALLAAPRANPIDGASAVFGRGRHRNPHLSRVKDAEIGHLFRSFAGSLSLPQTITGYSIEASCASAYANNAAICSTATPPPWANSGRPPPPPPNALRS